MLLHCTLWNSGVGQSLRTGGGGEGGRREEGLVQLDVEGVGRSQWQGHAFMGGHSSTLNGSMATTGQSHFNASHRLYKRTCTKAHVHQYIWKAG